MAKKIRFPLQMKGKGVRTIEELRDNFDLESILGYFSNGKLVTWLKDRYYDNEAMAVEVLTADDEKLSRKLCDILEVPYTEDAEEMDIETIRRRTEKLVLLREFTDDENIIDNVDSVAFNQDDLLDILDTGLSKMIYLCEGEFEIPLSVKNVTYIGLKNPIVLLRAYDNVNFSSLNLKFVDICYGWDVSHTTSADRMYQAERLFELGKIKEIIVTLKELAEEKNPRACYVLYKINGGTEKKLIDNSYDAFSCAEKMQSNPMLVKVLNKMIGRCDKFAMFILGKCYYNGLGVTKNDKKAVEWYHKAAEQGNALGQYNLGLCYDNGKGVEQDYEKAVEWYQKAAEQGLVYAQYNLGFYYENGTGVKQDYEKAVEWYQKAAEQGLASAQHNLGAYYYNIEQNYTKAVRWFQKAAEQELVYAQYMLGQCYYYGDGVEKNYIEAIEWFQKSVEQGNADAQDMLGRCYYYGRGVEENEKKAVEWFQKAAEQGNKSAKKSLAYCYEYGQGVSKDLEKAMHFYFETGASDDLNRCHIKLYGYKIPEINANGEVIN